MKKFYYYVATATLAAAAMFMASCSSDDDKPIDPPGPEKEVTITASPATIKADGTEAATFTVKYDNVDVTADAKTTIKNVASGENLTAVDGVYTFKTSTEGTYNFQATYDGKTSKTNASVTASNGTPPQPGDDFYKSIVLIKFTGTQCGPCTTYGEALHTVMEEFPGRLVKAEVHTNIPRADPYVYGPYAELQNFYLSSGDVGLAPSGTYDTKSPLRYQNTVEANATHIRSQFEDLLTNNPATCGIRVESTLNEATRKANAVITVMAKQKARYAVVAYLLQDSIRGPQANAGNNYLHMEVVRSQPIPQDGRNLGEIDVDKTASTTIEFDIPAKISNMANAKLLVYALKYDDLENKTINNGIYARLNEITDYRYEPAK